MKKFAFPIFVFLLIVVFDRIFKVIIQQMDVGTSIPVIRNIFHITYVINTGAGFGVLKNANVFLLFFSLIVFVIVVYYFFKEKKNGLRMALGMLGAGVLGNLIDRILYGAVIDFIDFRIWPVFNLADIAISVSIVTLIVIMFMEDRKKK